MRRPLLLYISPEACFHHYTGFGHPEKGVRLKAITRSLKKKGLLDQMQCLEASTADLRWILQVHSQEYIDEFRDACGKASFLHSEDSLLSAETYRAALSASGAVLLAVDKVMRAAGTRAFCALRPPGHHAARERAQGFCFVNHVAVAARYCQEVYGVERVCVVDWDAHHGNGTQSVFEDDPTVLFCSIHEDPRFAYPGTGFREEVGVGEGQGLTVNCPVPPGTANQRYLSLFDREIVPFIESFRPECLLLSAGFDAHRDDPLAGLCVDDALYALLTQRVCDLAERFCQGRLISVLEGGYNLTALCACVEAHVKTLLSL